MFYALCLFYFVNVCFYLNELSMITNIYNLSIDCLTSIEANSQLDLQTITWFYVMVEIQYIYQFNNLNHKKAPSPGLATKISCNYIEFRFNVIAMLQKIMKGTEKNKIKNKIYKKMSKFFFDNG